MKQSIALIILVIAISQLSRGQVKTTTTDTTSKKDFYNKEFKWRISIPVGFDTVSAEQYKALQKEGVKELEKSSNDKIEGGATRICAYKNNFFNYFEANHFFFDAKIDGDFSERCKKDDDEIYASYKSILFSNAKIDSAISQETVDNLVFRRFKLQISLNNKIIQNMYVYSRLFDNEEFSMVMVYVNEAKGESILNAWRNSKFDQN